MLSSNHCLCCCLQPRLHLRQRPGHSSAPSTLSFCPSVGTDSAATLCPPLGCEGPPPTPLSSTHELPAPPHLSLLLSFLHSFSLLTSSHVLIVCCVVGLSPSLPFAIPLGLLLGNGLPSLISCHWFLRLLSWEGKLSPQLLTSFYILSREPSCNIIYVVHKGDNCFKL